MKYPSVTFSIVLLIAVIATTENSSGELVVVSLNSPTLIDFDSTVAGSNNGTFAAAGLGNPPAAGQLDSTSWSIGGFSGSDDLARGESDGGVGTGGVYSFDVGENNRTLGVQPGGSDFTPGDITLAIANETGQTATGFSIGYDIWNLNDQNRSNSFNFSYSSDGTDFIDVPNFDFESPAASDSLGWLRFGRLGSFATNIAANSNLLLRWTGDDVSGGGSRDEFALDNISLSLTAVPEPTSFLLFGIACTPMLRRRRVAID